MSDRSSSKAPWEAIQKGLSLESYRHVFNATNDAIFIHDAKTGNILDANKAALDIFGYSYEELLKLNVGDLSSNQNLYDQKHALDRISQAVDKGLQIFDWQLKKKDGQCFWTQVSLTATEIGGKGHVLAVVRDIDERKKTEEALKKSTERYALAQKAASIGSWDWDIINDRLTWSEQIEPMFGFEKGQFGGTYNDFIQAVHPDDRQMVEDSVEACVNNSQLHKISHRIVWPDGTIRWLSETGDVTRDENGKAIRMAGIVQDITGQKIAADDLHQSQAKMQSIFRAAPTGIGLVSNRMLMQVNERMCQISGYSEDELIGKSARMLYPTEEEFLYVGQEKYRLIKEKGTGTVETRWVRKDGKIIDVLLSSTPLDIDDLTVGVTFTALDITEAKQSQQQREYLLSRLESKNDELQSIVYVASHDLRSPLVNITGFSCELKYCCDRILDILKTTFDEQQMPDAIEEIAQEKIPEAINFIEAGTQKIQKLLDGLLQVSRVGTKKFQPRELDINKLIEDIRNSMKFQLQQNEVTLNVGDTPGCIGDEDLINQVFTNLIDNAIKYCDPERNLQIDIAGTQTGNESIYSVQDNGLGIEERDLKKVFEMFHRVDNAKSVAGEGLGLSIASRIISQHNGRIWLESQAGKGSKFYIALPAIK